MWRVCWFSFVYPLVAGSMKRLHSVFRLCVAKLVVRKGMLLAPFSRGSLGDGCPEKHRLFVRVFGL